MSTKKTEEKKNTTKKDIENLKKELDIIKKELKEKDEKLIRSYADFQNYQKRIEKEIIHREEEIKRKYLLEFLDINESLKKVYEDNNPKEALKLIIKKIEDFLIFLVSQLKE